MKLVFASSGSVIFTPAATAVAAGLAPTLTGTWSLSSDETVLTLIVQGGLNGTLDIPELSATTLRFGSNITGTTNRLEFKWTAN